MRRAPSALSHDLLGFEDAEDLSSNEDEGRADGRGPKGTLRAKLNFWRKHEAREGKEPAGFVGQRRRYSAPHGKLSELLRFWREFEEGTHAVRPEQAKQKEAKQESDGKESAPPKGKGRSGSLWKRRGKGVSIGMATLDYRAPRKTSSARRVFNKFAGPRLGGSTSSAARVAPEIERQRHAKTAQREHRRRLHPSWRQQSLEQHEATYSRPTKTPFPTPAVTPGPTPNPTPISTPDTTMLRKGRLLPVHDVGSVRLFGIPAGDESSRSLSASSSSAVSGTTPPGSPSSSRSRKQSQSRPVAAPAPTPTSVSVSTGVSSVASSATGSASGSRSQSPSLPPRLLSPFGAMEAPQDDLSGTHGGGRLTFVRSPWPDTADAADGGDSANCSGTVSPAPSPADIDGEANVEYGRYPSVPTISPYPSGSESRFVSLPPSAGSDEEDGRETEGASNMEMEEASDRAALSLSLVIPPEVVPALGNCSQPNSPRHGLSHDSCVTILRQIITDCDMENAPTVSSSEEELRFLGADDVVQQPEEEQQWQAQQGDEEQHSANRSAQMRRRVVSEIVQTEEVYVANLDILVEKFVHPLKSNVGASLKVPQDKVNDIFGSVEILANFHHVMLAEMHKAKSKTHDTYERIPSVLLRFGDFLKMYTQYLNNYPAALNALNLLRNNQGFQAFLAAKRRECNNDLTSFLIMPVQRIPRYELLLRELLKHTPESHDEYQDLCTAFAKIQAIASHVNENKRQVENMTKLMEVQGKISGDFDTLLQPHRRLIREESLLKVSFQLGSSRRQLKQRTLFLFSDMIMWTTPSHDYRGHMDLSHAELEKEDGSSGEKGFRLRGRNRKAPLTFVCPSEAVRDDWMRELEVTIESARESYRAIRRHLFEHRRQRIQSNQAAGLDVRNLIKSSLQSLSEQQKQRGKAPTRSSNPRAGADAKDS